MLRSWGFAGALLLLALTGCGRPPAYAGTYRLVLSPGEKQTAGGPLAKGNTAQQRMRGADQTAITIYANGTWSGHSPFMADDAAGTYTVAGDKITFSVYDPEAAGWAPGTLVFNRADHTLTLKNGVGGVMVFKRK